MTRDLEEAFVLRCARTDPSVAEPPPAALRWDRVLGLAREQGVLALVARALAGQPGVPSGVRAAAAAEARALAAESLRMTGVLIELVSGMRRAGIDVLPFKGPTLAQQAYGDVGLRTFADLDLLVPPGRLEPARTVLLDRGFVPSYPTTAARRALLVRRGSHESLERPDGTLVELHWRVAPPVSEFGLDYDRLRRRARTVELAGAPVPALRADDLLLVLALHGAKHAWERLAWICDVAELVRSEPTLAWDETLGEARRMRAERVLLLAVRLASDLVGAPVPDAVGNAARGDRAVTRLAARVERDLFLPPRSGAGTLGFHLESRTRWGDKLGLALGSLVALNQRDLEAIPLPDGALGLYYLTRPARLAVKAVAHLVRP